MRALYENEEFVEVDAEGNPKIYNKRFALIRVLCPDNRSYVTTLDVWEKRDFSQVIYKTQEEKIESQLDKLIYGR